MKWIPEALTEWITETLTELEHICATLHEIHDLLGQMAREQQLIREDTNRITGSILRIERRLDGDRPPTPENEGG